MRPWEDVGFVRVYPGQIHVEGKYKRMFQSVKSIRLLRNPVPWFFLAMPLPLMYCMYYLGLFRSLSPNRPMFWIGIVGIIGLVVVGWSRSRRYVLDYTDIDGVEREMDAIIALANAGRDEMVKSRLMSFVGASDESVERIFAS